MAETKTRYSRPKLAAYVRRAFKVLGRKEAGVCQAATCLRVREIAGVLTRYVHDDLQPKPRRAVEERPIGACACGEPIKLGDRYTVPTTGTLTLKRPCQGRRCYRINEIVIRARAEIVPASWEAFTCGCGTPIYLREDYMGGARFGGPGFIPYDEDMKNRTVRQECRGCSCRWQIKIRFKTDKDDPRKTVREISYAPWRCAACKERQTSDAGA